MVYIHSFIFYVYCIIFGLKEDLDEPIYSLSLLVVQAKMFPLQHFIYFLICKFFCLLKLIDYYTRRNNYHFYVSFILELFHFHLHCAQNILYYSVGLVRVSVQEDVLFFILLVVDWNYLIDLFLFYFSSIVFFQDTQ